MLDIVLSDITKRQLLHLLVDAEAKEAIGKSEIERLQIENVYLKAKLADFGVEYDSDASL